jgi:hypothetical protein
MCSETISPRLLKSKVWGAEMIEVNLEVEAQVERRDADRRAADRRQPEGTSAFDGEERRKGPRRVKVERRRQIDPTTCERDYTADEIEFMRAMDDYKRRSGRQFPTWSEVLEVVRSLGYTRDTVVG